jgi:hypothetical protein
VLFGELSKGGRVSVDRLGEEMSFDLQPRG